MKKLFIMLLAISVLLLPNSVSAKEDSASNNQYFIVRTADGDYISDAEGNVYTGFKDALGNDVALEEALRLLLGSNKIENIANQCIGTLGISDPNFNIVYSYKQKKELGIPVKMTADYLGPCTISVSSTKTVGTTYGLQLSASFESVVFKDVKMGVNFNVNLSVQASITEQSTYGISAGKIGAVYFQPYFTHVKGTITFNGTSQKFDNKYPQYYGSNMNQADGLYYVKYSN